MIDPAIKLTAIIPAFNEERRIGATLRQYCSSFRQQNISFEMLVIINGCTDHTLDVAEHIRREFPEIHYKVYPERLGKGGAIIEGFKHAQGELILHADADGATPAGEIINLIDHLDDNDGIIASRRIEGARILAPQSLYRRVAGRIYNLFVRLVLGLPYRDTQCGAKIFTRDLVRNILFSLNTVDYAFDPCLLFQARKRGYRIREYPVCWADCKESKVNPFLHGPRMLYSIIVTRLGGLMQRQDTGRGEDAGAWDLPAEDIFFSIIVPCRTVDAMTEECLRECLKMSCENFEIILLPDDPLVLGKRFEGVRVVPTGAVKPSVKRNIGVREADKRAAVVAFLDSDAYPETCWLENSLPYFGNAVVGAVGGPNLTPPQDSLMQKAGGDVLSMPVSVGRFAVRYRARYDFRKRQSVKEMPSCNLLVRREVFESVGGFDTGLLTAEDSKLSFDIQKTGRKIIYAPDVKVYHHRRPLFRPHMKQVWRYGRDKMWLIKEDFSPDKLYYFIPLGFVAFMTVWGLTGAADARFRGPALWTCGLYAAIVLLASLLKNVRRSYLIFPGVVLTHVSYALGSLCGLMTRRTGAPAGTRSSRPGQK